MLMKADSRFRNSKSIDINWNGKSLGLECNLSLLLIGDRPDMEVVVNWKATC